ncbi:pentapeptide repeat-containing protein [Leptolyngbya sp. GB1-A1]|uniref:pentapeptide repeat-containing protein n=1 Tax=Leptolyngbya sp. GB1-A1 TaxID=2933908 RepID=UPI003297DC04
MHQESSRTSYREKSFRGKDLTGYDFGFADIRGTDFSNAILTNANFSHVRTGLKKQWVFILSLGIVIVSILAGSLSAYAGAAIGDFLLSKPPSQITVSLGAIIGSTIFVFVVFAVFLVVIIRQGLGGDLGKFAVITAAVVGILISLLGADISRTIILFDLVIISIGIAGSLLGALALAVSIFIFGTYSVIFLVLCISFGAFLGTWETISFYLEIGGSWVEFLAVACLISVPLIGLSFYIGWKSVSENKKYSLIKSIAVHFCSLGGTSFRGANLIDADFNQAMLPYADFRKANLKRVSWFQSSKLEFAQVKGTYLEDVSIRHLVVSRKSQEQVYDDKNLRGLNLRAANLSGASFIGADLSEANLEGANLARAKLVKAKLYSTNLSYSCLTGACIQDWAISTDTRLEDIDCAFVFMRSPTQDNPDPWRKPDNRNEVFQKGDFTDFIAPIIKTLDLYRQQNLDPRQITIALKSLDLITTAALILRLQLLPSSN